jgi:hypothetical protein
MKQVHVFGAAALFGPRAVPIARRPERGRSTMAVELGAMAKLACAVWAVAAEEAEEPTDAVAWMARNLIERQGLCAEAACLRLQGLRSGRAKPATEVGIDFTNTRYCRVFATLCRVWSGDFSDPTSGATLAHRHDEQPDWAERAVATALIGPWIFYRPVAGEPHEDIGAVWRAGALQCADEFFVSTTSQWRL